MGSWSLCVHVHVCHVRWDCTFAMLSRLVCRNGLHKHDFWEIIKSKIRHSYEAHTYLRHIGFARWFQRIESLFCGIEQTARPLETNAIANITMAENAAYQCMENGGRKHTHIDMFVAHCACREQCWDKVKDLDGSLENMLNVLSVLLVTRTLRKSTINRGNLRISTIQLYEEVPPNFTGSYMSYISLVDVRKIAERTATLNGRVHKD